jgi:hypothetical protein
VNNAGRRGRSRGRATRQRLLLFQEQGGPDAPRARRDPRRSSRTRVMRRCGFLGPLSRRCQTFTRASTARTCRCSSLCPARSILLGVYLRGGAGFATRRTTLCAAHLEYEKHGVTPVTVSVDKPHPAEPVTIGSTASTARPDPFSFATLLVQIDVASAGDGFRIQASGSASAAAQEIVARAQARAAHALTAHPHTAPAR